MKNILQHIIYKNCKINILRLDILHPDIQGNKYFKLKYNLNQAISENKEYILSFGGEYSNHIHALSIAGNLKNLNTMGIIRADKTEKLTNTLSIARKNGMDLYFASRSEFRLLRKLIQDQKTDKVFKILKEFNSKISSQNTYLIPEGGTNSLALKGTQEILSNTTNDFDIICVSIGTGGTIAGLISSKKESTKLLGFPSLKGNFFEKDITNILRQISDKQFKNWELNHQYHFGGFAAYNEELISFMNSFYEKYQIKLDPVYTGKMFYGIFDMINKGQFKTGDNILAIHTGGLQGIDSFKEKNGDLLKF